MEQNPSSSSRVDRRTIEKNRRIQMKALYSELNSLVPHHRSREVISVPDQLEEAANYIKSLQIKLERMKEKRERLLMGINEKQLPLINIDQEERENDKLLLPNDDDDERLQNNMLGMRMIRSPPQIDVHEMGSSLGVVLITGLDFQSMFNETIRILHEQGADVVHASFSILNDTVFHTIHAEVGERHAEGNGAARISERLKNFVYGGNSNDICIM